ncbi:hypothetical protein KCH_42370 [Kitasatospora cheerisanensis KCTC 2395]|uniref:Uncharacterized protein n=1 Tax=Kitasatospora cheerisanensis KCTC 2395 TaxID=1348663 RepID=A0A066Z273_9ACTN|nr:hypothetical protein KCH_42370 [Kitasatospora cheerisanensis KCTC 2395]
MLPSRRATWAWPCAWGRDARLWVRWGTGGAVRPDRKSAGKTRQ